MSRAVFNEELCKGCSLCIAACPKKILSIAGDRINHKGYHPATCTNTEACSGCAICARTCPDVAIEVYRS